MENRKRFFFKKNLFSPNHGSVWYSTTCLCFECDNNIKLILVWQVNICMKLFASSQKTDFLLPRWKHISWNCLLRMMLYTSINLIITYMKKNPFNITVFLIFREVIITTREALPQIHSLCYLCSYYTLCQCL